MNAFTPPLFTTDDHRYMARAVQLAGRGMYTTQPNPRVGCVIVRDGEIVGEGFHQRAGGPHAEVHALNAAGERARGATVYVTLEPCSHHGRTPPCADGLIAAGVGTVIAAMEDPNPRVAGEGLSRLHGAGIEVRCGLLEGEARALNPGFISRMQRGRPWVRSKLAMSLDGRTAMASGESKWITGDPARADVQHWRARSSAIVTGIGTVLADDPRMNLRLEGVEVVDPDRIVIDSGLRMPVDARMISLPGQTLVITNSDRPSAAVSLRNAGVEVLGVDPDEGRVNLAEALAVLAGRECNEILVEAGAVLNGSLLQHGLIDELVIYMAPHLMGSGARGLFDLPGLDSMAGRIELELRDVRMVGSDLRIIALPRTKRA